MIRGDLQAISEKYAAQTPTSRKLYEEARKYLPGGNSRDTVYWEPHPLYIKEASGPRLRDVDGNEYLDLWNNATSLILGHAHPSVVAAVTRQASLGSAYAAATPWEIELAKVICKRMPSVERVRFTNSGTEAMMQAIRLARAYTGRTRIAKFEGSYHGMYDSVYISVGPPVDRAGPSDAPVGVPDSSGIPPFLAADTVILPYNDIDATRAILAREADRLAAVIVEPLANRMGLVAPRRDFMEELRTLTAKRSILLVFDEVISFRVAPGGAQSRLGVTPDITVLGKIIGGGYPIGAFGGREEIMRLFDPKTPNHIHHHGTFNANPVSMVAGLATLEQMTEEAYARLDRMGAALRARVQGTLEHRGVPARVTGTASLFKIFFTKEEVVDYRSSCRANRALERALFLALIPHGVFFSPFGAGCLSVPMTEDDGERFCRALEEVVAKNPVFTEVPATT